MKLTGIFLVLLILFGVIFKLQGDKKYLLKTTKKLVKLSSPSLELTDMTSLKRVSQVAKNIHFDIVMKIDFEDYNYEGKSLNEFRSVFFAYLKTNLVKQLSVKDFTIAIDSSNNKRGEVSFKSFFQYKEKSFSCQTIFYWLKEKKGWFVKQIKVDSCSLNSF